LQVVKIPDSTVKILDIRFLDDRQIICTSVRAINGNTYPCLDIHDVPQTSHPITAIGVIRTELLPTIPLVVSFRFPPLQKPQPGCLWARPSQTYSHLSEFAIKLPRPSDLNYVNDQVITFRLEGKLRGKSEKLQGVILVSRLRDIMRQAVVRKSAKVAASAPKLQTNIDPNPHMPPDKVDSQNPKPAVPFDDVVSIRWEDWSDAVSSQLSKSSTVLEPRYTQVASLARSKKDKTCAVMMIRDYNQQTLHAPTGFMARNLGHPTENCDPEVKSEFQDYMVKPFRTLQRVQVY